MKLWFLIHIILLLGWILIDRNGTHFGTIMNYLRDGTVVLPDSQKGIAELLAEAKYYCITELAESCERALMKKEPEPICRVPLITSQKEEQLLISSSTKVSSKQIVISVVWFLVEGCVIRLRRSPFCFIVLINESWSAKRQQCMLWGSVQRHSHDHQMQTMNNRLDICFQPVVKLLINRHNNKYSYTNTSDDNLLKNIELFDKLSLRFSGRILFIKDVIGSSEICCWSFYGNGRKVAEVSVN